jgi:hypothetical protein
MKGMIMKVAVVVMAQQVLRVLWSDQLHTLPVALQMLKPKSMLTS